MRTSLIDFQGSFHLGLALMHDVYDFVGLCEDTTEGDTGGSVACRLPGFFHICLGLGH